MIEMPAPITKVIRNSIGVAGPRPRPAEPSAVITRPIRSARRAPIREISSEPGIATIANSRTGSPVSAATIFSLRSRSRWISGSTGGSARMVSRRSMPASQRRVKRGSDDGPSSGLTPRRAASSDAANRALSWRFPPLELVANLAPSRLTGLLRANGRGAALSTAISAGLIGVRAALTKPAKACNFRCLAFPPIRNEAPGMSTNRKKLLLPDSMGRVGWDLLKHRDDVEPVGFPNTIGPDAFRALLKDANGAALGVTPFGEPELTAAPRIQ